jgi:hypothetical protein
MKRVKDLKVGDHVYLLWTYGLDFETYFTVTEIRKKGTLATIKLTINEGYRIREAIAYGHVSSIILSWYGKWCAFSEHPLTTDRECVKRLTDVYEERSKEREIGITAKRLLKLLTKSI